MITFEHDGRDTKGYVLYAVPDGGAELRIDLGYVRPDRVGRVRISLPRLAPGAYQLAIAAYNAAGESEKIATAPAHVVVEVPTPPKPGKPIKAPSPKPNGTPASPTPATASPTPAPSSPTPTAGSPQPGALGRLWRIVVGSDN